MISEEWDAEVIDLRNKIGKFCLDLVDGNDRGQIAKVIIALGCALSEIMASCCKDEASIVSSLTSLSDDTVQLHREKHWN